MGSDKMFEEYSDVVSVDDLRKMLHLGRNAVYALLQDGSIETIRVGKKYIIPKTSAIKFLLSAQKGVANA